MVIKKITWQSSGIVIEYKTSDQSKINRKAPHGPLPEEQISHLEAVARFVIEKAEEEDAVLAAQEEAQVKFNFSGTKREPAEPVDGDIMDYPDEVSEDDNPDDPVNWDAKTIPMRDGEEIPDLARMEKDHVLWYLKSCAGKEAIIEDVKANFNKVIGSRNPREKVIERATDIIGKACKWK